MTDPHGPLLSIQGFVHPLSVTFLPLGMPYLYHRTIRLQDTDAAGVVYFANVLSMCHEAYEASLQISGIDLKTFVRGEPIAIPIVHASVDFLQPMWCGQTYSIQLTPKRLGDSKFGITYRLEPIAPAVSESSGALTGLVKPRSVGQATTVHVCIDSRRRLRMALPEELVRWLEMFQDEG